MIEIVPAVLPHTLDELKEKLLHLRGVAPLVQIDLVGENILAGEESVPFWEEFDFEFDLMTANSLEDARGAVSLGAARVVVHSDFPKAREALESLQQTRTGDYPVLVGLALQSTAQPDILKDFENFYDFIQVMGIAQVGAQGQPFDPRSLGLISALRENYPDLIIQVDGAVASHVRELVEAGANRLVVGSAIVGAENPQAVYKRLYTSSNAHRGEN